MPYSKADKAEYNRVYYAKKHGKALEVKTVLLPKSMVRELQKKGINVTRWLTARPVSLDDHRDLERELEAKKQRVEWQSSGIKGLQEEIRVLRAKVEMLPAMQDQVVLKRLAVLEGEVALHEAEHVLREAVGEYDVSEQRGG